MNPHRPVNLPLPRLAMAMPITAVASILHRITGVVLFVGMIFVFYLLDLAMGSAAGFDEAAAMANSPLGKFGVWVLSTGLAYHVVAGVRHLLLDFHVGDTLVGGRVGAWISIVAGVAAGVIVAVLLW